MSSPAHRWCVARVHSVVNGVYDLMLKPWGALEWRLAPNSLHGAELADDKMWARLTSFLLEGADTHKLFHLLEPPGGKTLARLRVQTALEGILDG